jgi:1-acyl-sn-glycerol-3-phosphate acyltransferase
MGYRLGRVAGQFIFVQTIRLKMLRREMAERPEAFLLAPTHLSHLEPFLISIILRRKVDWMARIEMFRTPLARAIMTCADAFAVNRQRPGHSSIRTAVNRLRAGRCVGVFPEGGVAQGEATVMRGGPFKQGVCLLAVHTGRPILPCIMIGTEKLNHIPPWLPFRRARLWLAFGDRLLYPPTDAPSRRAARQRLAAELAGEYTRLYAEALAHFNLDDSVVP